MHAIIVARAAVRRVAITLVLRTTYYTCSYIVFASKRPKGDGAQNEDEHE